VGEIIIVANRGPRDFVWINGGWATQPASGGLVSMITPLARQANVRWFCCVSEPPDAAVAGQGLFTTAADQADPGLHIVPVPLRAPLYHAYYGQISNEVLWMLQHRVIGPGGLEHLNTLRHEAWSRGYLEANRRLAAAIVASVPTPRAFLIQDYHLYPLPGLLRSAYPGTPILHFTHIPFPDVPLMQLLPQHWRAAILRGMLGADVVGMQTLADARAFLDCCEAFLDVPVDHTRLSITVGDVREVRVRVYPASTDPDELRDVMAAPEVEAARRRLVSQMGQLSVIRVDRLDPSKNQRNGFLAFGRLLEMRPDLRARLRFSAFLVPSRTDLSVYRAYRDAVYADVEAINTQFVDDCGGPPIQVFYTNDRAQALAAMERCDVLLVNSLADGMNLVAKEWALVSSRPGTLVVSETAGVAAEARDTALLVSPLDIEGTAQAIALGLDMPILERSVRLASLHERVLRWTARDWLQAQLRDLGVSGIIRLTALPTIEN
jgi:trehalose 6-phosphate synthase